MTDRGTSIFGEVLVRAGTRASTHHHSRRCRSASLRRHERWFLRLEGAGVAIRLAWCLAAGMAGFQNWRDRATGWASSTSCSSADNPAGGADVEVRRRRIAGWLDERARGVGNGPTTIV
jgi:hypothetical protein